VLVIAHDKPHLITAQTAVPRNDVRADFFVGLAQVRPVIDVVNRRCQIEAGHG
jgi:hypothetical protein